MELIKSFAMTLMKFLRHDNDPAHIISTSNVIKFYGEIEVLFIKYLKRIIWLHHNLNVFI